MGTFAKINKLMVRIVTEKIGIRNSINKRVLSVFRCKANRGNKNEKDIEPIDNSFKRRPNEGRKWHKNMICGTNGSF